MNFLERLVADWYGHQGYLVLTNYKFGPRADGGYAGEMDVLAAKLATRELIHIETSSDADSWKKRLERVERKFRTAEKHYTTAFGFEFATPKRLAVVGPRPPKKPVLIDGIEIISIDELMSRIKTYVAAFDPMSRAVPEGYGYLRAVQFATWFGKPPKNGS